MRPLLVGELNPLSSDPRLVLYPLPPNSAGGRLARIFGLSPSEYLRRFDRANLCAGRWDRREAERAARAAAHRVRVLLGARVAAAHGLPFRPFRSGSWHPVDCPSGGAGPRHGRGCFEWLVLPHPSGRCRAWNDPAAAGRARAELREFLEANRKRRSRS